MNSKLARGGTIWDRVLSGIIVLALLGALGMLGYIITNPRAAQSENFTEEFYILGLSGKAQSYPKSLTVGEEEKVVVGIVNREEKTVTYQVEVRIDGVSNNETEPVMLDGGGKWEGIVAFTPRKAGIKQKVEFLLYRQGESRVYQSLYLQVKVQ